MVPLLVLFDWIARHPVNQGAAEGKGRMNVRRRKFGSSTIRDFQHFLKTFVESRGGCWKVLGLKATICVNIIINEFHKIFVWIHVILCIEIFLFLKHLCFFRYSNDIAGIWKIQMIKYFSDTHQSDSLDDIVIKILCFVQRKLFVSCEAYG